jgi:drug/metabolite transporter, DME family
VSYRFYSALAVITFGFMPFCKGLAVQGGLHPVTAAVSIVSAALVTAAIVGGAWKREALRWPAPAALAHLALIGVLSSGIVVLMNVAALAHTSAPNLRLVQAAYPAATLFFAWWLLGERLRATQYALAALVALGLWLANPSESGTENPGFWLLLGTMPIIGFCDAYAKRHMTQLTPGILTVGRFGFGLILLLVAAPFGFYVPSSTPSASAIYWAVLAGVLAAIGMSAFYRALKLKNAGLVAATVATAPVITALAEWAFQGHTLRSIQLLGIALVVIGAVRLSLSE